MHSQSNVRRGSRTWPTTSRCAFPRSSANACGASSPRRSPCRTRGQPLAFDFAQPADRLLAASVNGQAFAASIEAGHIVLPAGSPGRWTQHRHLRIRGRRRGAQPAGRLAVFVARTRPRVAGHSPASISPTSRPAGVSRSRFPRDGPPCRMDARAAASSPQDV